MFVKPFSSYPDTSGNGLRRGLISVNSILTLCLVRLIRNRSIRFVHRFHSPGEGLLGRHRRHSRGRIASIASITQIWYLNRARNTMASGARRCAIDPAN